MLANPDVTTWATAISTNASTDRRIIWRFAKDFSPEFDRASQPNRIIIAWKYHSENGQPIPEDHQRMNSLEDALEPLLARNRFATLALVSTGENLREWTYYAKSEDEFIDCFNLALDGMAEFPIEIHTAPDPTWSMYSEFRSGVTERWQGASFV